MIPKYNLKVITTYFIVANLSLSWGDVNKYGIWCELDSTQVTSEGKGFFFFDDIQVGFFETKQIENKKNDVRYTDLSTYKTHQNFIYWESLTFDNYSKEFTTHSFELNNKTLKLSHRITSSKIDQEFNCEVYPEWKTFLEYLKKYN